MIAPVGYFKLWRELFNKPIWLNSSMEQKVILITLLGMANFRPKQWEWQGKKFITKEGQFITSLKSIVENCGQGVTYQNVRTAIVRFEKLEFLTNESTKTGRLITIMNWHVYQQDDIEANKDTNKDLTKTQQRPNKQLTPREEGLRKKEGKKGNKSTYAENVTMLPDEYEKLLKEHGKLKTKRMIEILDNYKGANNKKYASDYRAILNWVIKRYEEDKTKAPQKKSIKDNFEQREYTDDFLEGLYFNAKEE